MEQIIEVDEKALPANVRAIQITERIKANGRIAVNAVCSIGKDLRTMKIDKLYTELGYEEFEDYAEKEFQLKRRQAYQYISVYEKLGEEFVQSNAQLGITKLALLAAANPEDRAEVMEAEDVQDMTAKELEELLAKYKEQGEQLAFLQDQNAGLVKENEELTAELAGCPTVEKEVIREVPDPETEEQLRKANKKLVEATSEKESVQKELNATKSELEMYKKSAADVKKQVSEAEKKAKAEFKERKAQLEADNKAIREKAEQEKAALEAKIAELQKAAEKPADSTDKSNFKAMLSAVYRDILGLTEFIKETEDIEERKQYLKKAMEIKMIFEDSIKKIDIPAKIPKESLKSRGIIDIGSIPSISRSNDEEEEDMQDD